MELVRKSGIRVSRSRPVLASPAHNRPLVLGGHAVFRIARPATHGTQRQYAVAILLLRALDSGLLCRWSAGPAGNALHHNRFLAFLGCASVGRGLPRIVYDDH